MRTEKCSHFIKHVANDLIPLVDPLLIMFDNLMGHQKKNGPTKWI